MKTRIIYGILLFPIVVFLLIFGDIPLRIGLLVVSLVAFTEISKAIWGKIEPITYIGYVFLVFHYFFIEWFMYNFFVVFFALIIINLIYVIASYPKTTPFKSFSYIVLPIYTGVFLSLIYMLREINPYIVWFVFVSAWGSDTFCYFVGKKWGKHKLAKKLSPNKTVEGSLGGVIGVAIISFLYSFLLAQNHIIETHLIFIYTIISIVLAVFSQVGDLVASAVKRHLGIKDFGNIIPGHGGAMDRFDSIIFISPILYIIATI
ncbi:MAG: phosphatidate cytidylyltransferase [Defluviitaleaceae bacterium]|nr:phosphatidate cytidylyltransferase [Defluviitaleaceae bacterium]